MIRIFVWVVMAASGVVMASLGVVMAALDVVMEAFGVVIWGEIFARSGPCVDPQSRN